jgi:hypothetical protein
VSAGEWWLVGIAGAMLAGVLAVVLLGGAACPQGQQMVQTGVILISNGQGGFTYIPELACEPQ